VICSRPKSSFRPAIEDHITLADAKAGRSANADHVHPEVAEHLVGLPGHSVTLHAIALPKKISAPRFCASLNAAFSPRA